MISRYIDEIFLLFTLLLVVMLIVGCATNPPPKPPEREITVDEIAKPVPVKCVPDDFKDDPMFSDSNGALNMVPFPGAEDRLMSDPTNMDTLGQVYQNLHYRVRLLIAGRIQKNRRLEELNVVVRGCR